MTAGERWAEACTKRLAGYCKAHGFRLDGPVERAFRGDHYTREALVYTVLDPLGGWIELSLNITGPALSDTCYVAPDSRLADFEGAATFDSLTAALRRQAPKASKKQLCFAGF